MNSALATQQIMWSGSDGAGVLVYDTMSENIGGAGRTLKITGECSNAGDSITQKLMLVRRVK